MKNLAAGGFKDITRIASSSPVMWQQICLKNQKNISRILGDYIEALKQAKESVDKGSENDLFTLFEILQRLSGFHAQQLCRTYQEALCRVL